MNIQTGQPGKSPYADGCLAHLFNLVSN